MNRSRLLWFLLCCCMLVVTLTPFALSVVDIDLVSMYPKLQVVSDELYRFGRSALGQCSISAGPLLVAIGTNGINIVAEVTFCHEDRVLFELLAGSCTGSPSTVGRANTAPVTVQGVRSKTDGIYTALVQDVDLPLVDGCSYSVSVSVIKDGAVLHTKGTQWRQPGRRLSPSTPVPEPANSGSVRIGVISDPQYGAPIFRRLQGHLASAVPPVDLLVHGGDGTQDPSSNREAFLYQLSPLDSFQRQRARAGHPSAPLVFVSGNHDNPQRLHDYTAGNTNAVIDVGGLVRIIVIDSEMANPRTIEWLRGVCKPPDEAPSPNGTWTIGAPRAQQPGIKPPITVAFIHVAPYIEWWDPAAWNGAGKESEWNTWVREEVLPILASSPRLSPSGTGDARAGATSGCDVSLVISGHSHVYQRGRRRRRNSTSTSGDTTSTAPSEDAGTRTDRSQAGADGDADRIGPYFIIAGGGGGSLEVPPDSSPSIFGEKLATGATSSADAGSGPAVGPRPAGIKIRGRGRGRAGSAAASHAAGPASPDSFARSGLRHASPGTSPDSEQHVMDWGMYDVTIHQHHYGILTVESMSATGDGDVAEQDVDLTSAPRAPASSLGPQSDRACAVKLKWQAFGLDNQLLDSVEVFR